MAAPRPQSLSHLRKARNTRAGGKASHLPPGLTSLRALVQAPPFAAATIAAWSTVFPSSVPSRARTRSLALFVAQHRQRTNLAQGQCRARITGPADVAAGRGVLERTLEVLPHLLDAVDRQVQLGRGRLQLVSVDRAHRVHLLSDYGPGQSD